MAIPYGNDGKKIVYLHNFFILGCYMKYKNDLEKVIKRYKAFWNKDKLDRIPIRIRFPSGSLQAHESYYEKENKKKELEKWEDLIFLPEKYLYYWEKQLLERVSLEDDSIPCAPLDFGPALMCGVMGADIYFNNGTSWSTHPLKDWSDLDSYKFDLRNKWLKMIIDTAKYFINKSENNFFIGLPNLTGPADIAACLRGIDKICMDFYEYPGEIHNLLNISVDAYIKVIDILSEIIPQYYGGTCEGYMMWTPGRGNWLACDLSNILSPEHYQQHIYEYDQKIVDYLDNCWIHVHSGGAVMIKEFLKLNGLIGVQIVDDKPSGPAIKELLPVLKKIQKNHCLILRKFTIEEIKSILPDLSPTGLFIDTQCNSLQEAKMLLEEWNILTTCL